MRRLGMLVLMRIQQADAEVYLIQYPKFVPKFIFDGVCNSHLYKHAQYIQIRTPILNEKMTVFLD